MEDSDQTSVETSVEKSTADKPVDKPVDIPVEIPITETLVEKSVETTPRTTSMGQGSENVPLQENTQEKTSSIDTNNGNGEAKKQPYALIDQGGICSSCDDTRAQLTSFKCFFCKLLYHATCTTVKGFKTGKEIICTSSFYTNFEAATNSEIAKTRRGNFVFICNFCMTKHEHREAATAETKVDTLNKRVDSLSDTVNEIKALLETAISSPSVPLQLNTPNPQLCTDPVGQVANNPQTDSWAGIARKKLKRSVLFLENKDGKKLEDAAILKEVQKVISDNTIPLDESFPCKNGGMAYVCPTEEDRKTLSEKLTALPTSVKTSVPPDRLPTIGIANIDKEYSVTELRDKMLFSQSSIKACVDKGDEFKILNVKPHRYNNDKYQATIRVSSNIRKIIELQGDKLYINDPNGNFSCSVFDRFHVKRCNKCQHFGHYETNNKGIKVCTETQYTCGYCSGPHESQQCPLDPHNYTPCCTNCKNHNKFDSEKHSHTAFDRACPAYIAEQDKLKRSINFYNQKNQ
jgi:hypothetical protein